MQRAFVLLLRGDVRDSLLMFPALIPILLMLCYLVFHLKFNFGNGARNLKFLLILNATIIVFSYIYKQF